MWIFLGIGFVVLLLAFPRQVLVVVVITVAAAAVLILWTLASQRHDQAERDRITVALAYDAKTCPAEHPVSVKVSNGSSRTVLKVEWDVSAFRPGYSTDLALYGYHAYSTDKILAPGEGVALCYLEPKLKEGAEADVANLTLKATNVWPTFKD